MKKKILLFTLALFPSFLNAQLQPIFSQYPDHFELENPAAIFDSENMQWQDGGKVSFLGRMQWISKEVDGTPRSTSIYGNWIRNNYFIGGQLFYDKVGIIRTSNIGLSYGIKLSDHLILAGRLDYGFLTIQPNDQLFFRDQEDDWLVTVNDALSNFNNLGANIGTFYFKETSNGNFFLGLSGKLIAANSIAIEKYKINLLGGFRWLRYSISSRIRYSSIKAFPMIDAFFKFYFDRNFYIGAYYSLDFNDSSVIGGYIGYDFPRGGSTLYKYNFSMGYGQRVSKFLNSPILDLSIKSYF